MMIEIRGTQFVNKGAELMLRAILEKIKQYWPEADICLQANQNTTMVNINSIHAYRRLNIRKNILDANGLTYFIPTTIRKFLKKKYRVVLEADVDVIMDASGFAYGDQWSSLVLRQVSQDVTRFKKKKKHYVFLPQALGPFTRDDNVSLAKKVFDNASLVFAREQKSLQYVKNISHISKVIQAPDFTNLLEPVIDEQYLSLDGKIAIIPNSKMLSDKNNDKQWRKVYIDFLVRIVSVLQKKGEDVFLLNHEGSADEAICMEVNNRLNGSIDIVAPNCAIQVKAIIGQCKLVVCSRFHGCVSALSQGVPCIATSWSHKYEQLFSEYQQSTLIRAPIFDEQLISLISTVLENRSLISESLNEISDQQKERSKNMWFRAATAINNE